MNTNKKGTGRTPVVKKAKPKKTDRLRTEEPKRPIVIEPNLLYVTAIIASFLGLKKQTLEKWRVLRTGGPRFVKIGGAVRYRGEDVLEWLKGRIRSCDGSIIGTAMGKTE